MVAEPTSTAWDALKHPEERPAGILWLEACMKFVAALGQRLGQASQQPRRRQDHIGL